MRSIKRRTLLKVAVGGYAVAMAVGAGLLVPWYALAAWPKEAFNAKAVGDALNNLYQSDALVDSGNIKIKTQQTSTNGAVVPVTIETSLPNAESISVIVEKNTRPLAGQFVLTDAVKPKVSTRIKVAKSSRVMAVIKADGKLHTAAQEVEVTVGDDLDQALAQGMDTLRRLIVDLPGSSVTVSAKLKGDVAVIKALFRHPMATGNRKDKNTGELIPEHVITEVVCEHNGKIVMTANWGAGISENPFLSFDLVGARKGDSVKVSWVDNKGETGSGEGQIK